VVIEYGTVHVPGEANADLRRLADNANRGAVQAARLTRQLLAVSRRQPLDPKSVNLNDLVSSVSDMLQRTLGEKIVIEAVLGADLWWIKALEAGRDRCPWLQLGEVTRSGTERPRRSTDQAATWSNSRRAMPLQRRSKPGRLSRRRCRQAGQGRESSVESEVGETRSRVPGVCRELRRLLARHPAVAMDLLPLFVLLALG
jgi:hypothetical protein